MKTSSVLSSLLLSALAAAAPVQQRDLATKIETVTETVVIYTTVWDDYVPPATAAPTKATSAPGGQFFEKPPSSTLAVEVKPTTSKDTPPAPPAYTPPAAPSSSTQAPAPAPEPTTTVAPPAPVAPAPEKPSTPEAPSAAPVLTTSLQQAAPAAPTSAPAAPAPPSSGGGGSFTGEMTIYDAQGNLGACGKPIQDTDPVVALGKPTWGESTYDVQTGASSNPWCGKKINIHYNGKTTSATILDLCPECKAGDIDLTPSLWQTVTGGNPKDGGRYPVSWSPA